MTHTDRSFWILAAGLAGLAGYVDAIGFLKLGGLFVSFMSGNSTRLAVSLANGSDLWQLAFKLIVAFVAGVVAGSYVSWRTKAWRKPIVMVFVTILLTLAAMVNSWHFDYATVLLLAAAIGAADSVFQLNGEVSIGVTYMTGTLVKLGQHATAALTGGPLLGWLPYLLLWCGLVSGAVLGASLYVRLGSICLWGAPATAVVLTILAAYLTRGQRQERASGSAPG